MKDLGGNMSKYITAPIAGAVTASIWQFADLEQAVGGIETLFKSSADAVIKNSESAYKRAGISGVDYMENVTSFSASLLSGLGGDTEQAAKIADMAMVDMSDNANKFGTDIGDIQNAYQGFAKDNFMMLDNLKLGFAGTKGGMEELLAEAEKISGRDFSIDSFSDMIEAINIIQTEMGVTGTTALEAEETVSGAFGMMKASLSDLAAGFGQEGANIEQLIQNLFDSVGVFADNIIRVLKTMWDNLPIPDWAKWLGGIVVVAGPIIAVVGTILSAIGGFATAIAGTTGIVGAFTALFPNVAAGFGLVKGAISLILGPIGLVVGAIVGLIAIFVHLYKTNEEFRDKVNAVWTTIKDGIMGAVDIVVNFVSAKVEQLTAWWNENQEQIRATVETVWNFISDLIIGIMEFLTPYLQVAWTAIQEVFMTVWTAISGYVEIAMGFIMGIIEAVMMAIDGNWSGAWAKVQEVLSNAWLYMHELIIEVLGMIRGTVVRVLDAIAEKFGVNLDDIRNKVDVAFNFIADMIDIVMPFIKDIIKGAWDVIVIVFKTAVDVIKGVISFFSSMLKGDFEGMKTALTSIWKALWNGIKNVVSSAWGTLVGAFEGLKSRIRSWFTRIKDDAIGWGKNMIQGFVDGIKSKISAVTDAVSNVTSAVKGFLGFSSPTKKGEGRHIVDWGANMIDGFLDGVRSQERNAQLAMNNIVGAMQPSSMETIDINGSIARSNAQIGSRISHEIGDMEVNTQPAYINVNIGGQNFRGFVENISSEQGRMTDLEMQF